MSTTMTHRHKIGNDLADFAFRFPWAQRRQMQAIAEYRGWSEAEAMRRAIALFLSENRDLLQVITSKIDDGDDGRS